MSDTRERWSSRKFWSMMLWQTVNTACLATGLITESTYETLTMFLLGTYFLANVAQKSRASQ